MVPLPVPLQGQRLVQRVVCAGDGLTTTVDPFRQVTCRLDRIRSAVDSSAGLAARLRETRVDEPALNQRGDDLLCSQTIFFARVIVLFRIALRAIVRAFRG